MQITNLNPAIPTANQIQVSHPQSLFKKVLIVALSILIPAAIVASLAFIPVVFAALGIAGIVASSAGAGALGLSGALIYLMKNRSTNQIPENGITIAEHNKQYPSVDEKTKYAVRDKTMEEVMGLLDSSIHMKYRWNKSQEMHKDFEIWSKMFSYGLYTLDRSLPDFLDPFLNKIKLYESDQSKGTCQGTQLLGRYDVLQAPCLMAYDHNWKKHEHSQTPFLVHHAAAINIGECAQAEDFNSFQLGPGNLNENAYLDAMENLFAQVMQAQSATEVKHTVWFPFGMGAFLRHLDRNDPSYTHDKLNLLRKKIAERFVNALQRHYANKSMPTIHLCLPTGTDQKDPNFLAFTHALKEASKISIQLHLNVDATHVAQQLANVHGEYSVSLVNGANRNLIGNHWFADRALVAIDENLHRRSPLTALISFLLNNGTELQDRTKEAAQLHARIKALNPT